MRYCRTVSAVHFPEEFAMPLTLRLLVVLALELSLGLNCALADCARDRTGTVRYSNVIGGGAETDPTGGVKCLGGCEPSSDAMCTKAVE